MNLKDKAKEIFQDKFKIELEPKEGEITLNFEYIYEAAVEFAKIACEEQKKICAENAELIGEEPCIFSHCECKDYSIDKDSILNSPTVKFD